jgi:hypothetical protein
MIRCDLCGVELHDETHAHQIVWTWGADAPKIINICCSQVCEAKWWEFERETLTEDGKRRPPSPGVLKALERAMREEVKQRKNDEDIPLGDLFVRKFKASSGMTEADFGEELRLGAEHAAGCTKGKDGSPCPTCASLSRYLEEHPGPTVLGKYIDLMIARIHARGYLLLAAMCLRGLDTALWTVFRDNPHPDPGDRPEAGREVRGPELPFRGARLEMKEHFGIMLGQELAAEDFDRLFDTIEHTGKSVLDFAVEAIRTRTSEVLDQAKDGGPGS